MRGLQGALCGLVVCGSRTIASGERHGLAVVETVHAQEAAREDAVLNAMQELVHQLLGNALLRRLANEAHARGTRDGRGSAVWPVGRDAVVRRAVRLSAGSVEIGRAHV